jgi:hypothetical protein
MIAHGKYCVTDKEASVGEECPKETPIMALTETSIGVCKYSRFMLCKMTEIVFRLFEILSINLGC